MIKWLKRTRVEAIPELERDWQEIVTDLKNSNLPVILRMALPVYDLAELSDSVLINTGKFGLDNSDAERALRITQRIKIMEDPAGYISSLPRCRFNGIPQLILIDPVLEEAHDQA